MAELNLALPRAMLLPPSLDSMKGIGELQLQLSTFKMAEMETKQESCSKSFGGKQMVRKAFLLSFAGIGQFNRVLADVPATEQPSRTGS